MKNQLRNLIRRIDRGINLLPGRKVKKKRFRRPKGPVVITQMSEGSLEDFMRSEIQGMTVQEKLIPQWNKDETEYEMVKSGRPTEDTVNRIKEKISGYLKVRSENVLVNVQFRSPDIGTPYLSVKIID